MKKMKQFGSTAFFLVCVLGMLSSLLACSENEEKFLPEKGTNEHSIINQNEQENAAKGDMHKETISYTDSLGREIEIPYEVKKIAVTGPLAQMMVFAVAPEKMVGLASAWDETAKHFINKEYHNLPVLGQLFGGKGNLNMETILDVSPDLIIDMGEAKEGIASELDELQNRVGIPFIHISCSLSDYDMAFRELGIVLDKEKEGNALADYCRETYQVITDMMNTVGNKKKRVVFCTMENGTHVIAKGSYQAELLDLLTDNVAIVANKTSRGTGDEVGLEQILLWNPDYIIFNSDSYYEGAKKDMKWKELEAIQKNQFYEVPFGPYNWAGNPPSVQRYLGMLWMGELLYQDYVTYDLKEEVKEYYELFYHHELTEQQYEELLVNSIGKRMKNDE